MAMWKRGRCRIGTGQVPQALLAMLVALAKGAQHYDLDPPTPAPTTDGAPLSDVDDVDDATVSPDASSPCRSTLGLCKHVTCEEPKKEIVELCDCECPKSTAPKALPTESSECIGAAENGFNCDALSTLVEGVSDDAKQVHCCREFVLIARKYANSTDPADEGFEQKEACDEALEVHCGMGPTGAPILTDSAAPQEEDPGSGDERLMNMTSTLFGDVIDITAAADATTDVPARESPHQIATGDITPESEVAQSSDVFPSQPDSSPDDTAVRLSSGGSMNNILETTESVAISAHLDTAPAASDAPSAAPLTTFVTDAPSLVPQEPGMNLEYLETAAPSSSGSPDPVDFNEGDYLPDTASPTHDFPDFRPEDAVTEPPSPLADDFYQLSAAPTPAPTPNTDLGLNDAPSDDCEQFTSCRDVARSHKNCCEYFLNHDSFAACGKHVRVICLGTSPHMVHERTTIGTEIDRTESESFNQLSVMGARDDDLYDDDESAGIGYGIPILLLFGGVALGGYAFRDNIKEALGGKSRLARPQAQYSRVPAHEE